MFKPTYIYIKTCNHCNLKYIGKSTLKTEKKVHNYTGSGLYWKPHLKKHSKGYKSVIINYFNENEKQQCKDFCLFVSNFFNVEKSDKWANLKLENGLDGGDTFSGRTHAEKTKKLMSEKQKGKIFSEEHKKIFQLLTLG